MQVVDVAQEQRARVLIAGGVHRLRKVDDHWTIRSEQHVEIREISVDDARRKHARRLVNQVLVDFHSFARGKLKITQSRRGIVVLVDNELHDENPIDENKRLGNPHTGIAQAINHLDFRRFPAVLVLLLAVLRAFGDGALIAGVSDLAPLDVVRLVLERTILSVFVDLGGAVMVLGDDEEDLRFFAAHERTQYFLNDALISECLQTLGDPHNSGRGGRKKRFGTGSSGSFH